jgi:hypothetical protein
MHETLKAAPEKGFSEPDQAPEPGKDQPAAAAAVAAQGGEPGAKAAETVAESSAKKRAARPANIEAANSETAKLNRQQLNRDPGEAVEEAAYGPRWRERQQARSEPTTTPAEPTYPPPRQPGQIASGPAFPAPWGTAYARPGGGYAGPAMPPPPVPVPRYERTPYMPTVPTPGQRPGPIYGTGGLY